ncbi:hypothetical protein B0T10DRAFT_502719, partial [Thelonectria olida]
MPTNSATTVVIVTRGGLHENHTSFLKCFNTQQAWNQAAKQKPTLSIEEHATHWAQLGTVCFIKLKYS